MSDSLRRSHSSKSKVRELSIPILIKKNVGRFEVPKDDLHDYTFQEHVQEWF